MSEARRVRSTGLRPVTPNRDKKATVTRAEVDLWVEKVTDLVSHQPDKAAKILTDWLHTAERSAKKRKTG